ncbi:MAG: HD domain-containing protein [Chloroflexota bacterium]
MTTTANARFQRIAEFVLRRREDTLSHRPDLAPSLEYRWKHTLRVAHYGKQLAEAEGANTEIVVAGCLLHDVARFEVADHGVEHGRVGARIARPLLEELGYAPADVDNICFSIAVHVDDRADFEHPVTLESKIVNDADNIDRFSAYRILLHFRDTLDDYETLVARAAQRVEKLKRYRQEAQVMGTETGNRLFKRQLDLQIEVFERLVADSRITKMPEI